MALSTFWISVASILHSFNITKAIDSDGKLIEPKVVYIPGVIKYVDAYALILPESSLVYH